MVYPPINEDAYDFAPIKELVDFIDLSSDDDFKDSIEQYFNKESVLKYYLFCMVFNSVDTLSKNLHLCRYNDVFYILPYDCDSAVGGNNQGYLNVPADAEVGDLYDENDPDTIIVPNHYNSWNSRLWARVRDTFRVDLESTYISLRSNGVFTINNILKYFDEIIDVIPPTMYNESQQIKYIDYGEVGQIALHGNRKLQIRKHLRERLAYLDSKYGFYSDGGTENYVNLRMAKIGDVSLQIETYYPVYYTVKWASNRTETHRIAKGEKVSFSYYSDVSADREVLLYLPETIKVIEGLNTLQPTTIDISKATKLNKIECSSEKLYSVSLATNKYLRRVDFNGCKLLGSDTTSTLSLLYAKYLNYVDIRGTTLNTVNFNPQGGSLKKCYLPNTLTSLTLKNQMLLTDLILPYGNNGEDVAKKLATVEISNCPSIKRVSEIEGENMFAVMKYCRSIILNSSFNLESMDFNGFTRLQNITLSNIDALKDIGLNDLCEAGTASNLKYIGVSACLNLKTINMNCSSSDYVITFADDSLLDLSTSNVTTIHSNCIIKGLKTIVVPRTIEEMYFTNDYGSGYSDIKNIWSTSSSVIDSSGVFPSAKHMNAETFITDDYVGIDFYGLKLKNIDLGALVNIPEAINFSLSPTTVNPTFNLHRNGTSIPYLKPHGVLDLSNYVGSLAKFFNGVDLDKMQLKVEKNLPQEDFSYCFFNSTFSDESYIMPLISKITAASNLNYTFYKTTISTYNILDEILLADKGCTMDYTFGECPNITNTDGLKLGNNVKSAIGMFYKNPNLTSAEDMIIKLNGSVSKMYESCKKLNKILGSTLDNVKDTSYMFNDCVRLSEMFDKLPSSCNNANYMYANTNVGECDFRDKQFGSETCTYVGFIYGASSMTVYLKSSTGNCTAYGGVIEGCSNIIVDISNLNTSNFSDFTNWFKDKTGLVKIILDDVVWANNDLIFTDAFNGCTSLIEDFNFPINTVNVARCYKNCTSMINVISNWNKTFNKSVESSECYLGCNKIKTIDGENVLNELVVSGIELVPIKWGGMEFTPNTTGIYVLDIPNDNYTIEIDANSMSTTNELYISWGDGALTRGERSHVYTLAGTYTIKAQTWLNKEVTAPTTSIQATLSKVLQTPNVYINDTTRMYSGCTKLSYVNMSNTNLDNVGNSAQMFENDSNLVDVILDFSNAMSGGFGMYQYCSKITKFTKEMLPKNMSGGGFQLKACTSLTEVEYIAWDNLHGTFSQCRELTTIGYIEIGSNYKYSLTEGFGQKISNVVFAPYKGILWTQDYFGFLNEEIKNWNLNKNSLLSLFSILGDISGGESIIINLGAKQLARLTDEEKAIALDKGWSLA